MSVMGFSLRTRRLQGRSDSFTEPVDHQEDEKKLKKHQNQLDTPCQGIVQERIRLIILTALSLYFRVLKLGHPPFITEMEMETSRQTNWYMANKYFIGKYPPLSGLINTGLAYIVGYYGTEDLLYAGQEFHQFPLVGMRRLAAILGALIVPICYLTLRNMGHSRSTCTLAAILLILENGHITQSRYASPEVFVLFFSAAATFVWTIVRNHLNESDSYGGLYLLFWKILTGLCIGLSISSKWTGALILPVIWYSIGREIWSDMTDTRQSIYVCLRKLYVYLFSVGVFPFWVYMFIFKMHFDIASKAGDHDLILSSRFRYSLVGNEFEPSQQNIAYGSQIVIKHDGSPGGYLHSHKDQFTGGSKQQEVTLYPYVDLNNIWTVHKKKSLYNSSQPLELVHNGDQIRLEHFASTRKLHSHDYRPQITSKREHQEVTAYGDKLVNDVYDYWTLIVLDDDNRHSKDMNITWQTLNQRFRLLHIRGCALISHGAYYEGGGHNHQEVTCMASAGLHVSTWIVESAYHEKLESAEPVSFTKMKFIEKFRETHKLMLKYPFVVYNRLEQGIGLQDGLLNPKLENPGTPMKWFLKRKSSKLWYKLSGFSVHLVLNAAVQKFVTSAIVGYMGLLCLIKFLAKRQIKLPTQLSWLNIAGTEITANQVYKNSISLLSSAVASHVIMLRLIPPHTVSMSDILPSIYYGTSLSSVILEGMVSTMLPIYRRALYYGLIVLTLLLFSQQSHLTYGTRPWHRTDCESSGIDINCIHFPLYEHELKEFVEQSGETPNATDLTVYFNILGKTEPFRYTQGQENEAEQALELLKQTKYQQEAERSTGIYRYHRVVPTPAITLQEAIDWSKSVHEKAIERENEAAKKRAEKKALRNKKRGKRMKKRKTSIL
ncbi:unnamed protein product [Rhizopus microsporus]